MMKYGFWVPENPWDDYEDELLESEMGMEDKEILKKNELNQREEMALKYRIYQRERFCKKMEENRDGKEE